MNTVTGDEVRKQLEMDSDWSDWAYAFECCGPPDGAASYGGFNSPDVRPVPPKALVGLAPFQRSDVAEIRGIAEGENDGPDWLVCGKLNDGRFFMLRAGCDYTGWDCQSGGNADVAVTWGALLRYGITADEAIRMGLTEGDHD